MPCDPASFAFLSRASQNCRQKTGGPWEQVRAMASSISSAQLLHNGSKAIVTAHTLTHTPQHRRSPAKLRGAGGREGRGTERAGTAGKGVCGQVAPPPPGPARPPPARASPAPLQPRDPPPPSAAPRSRPEAARPRAAESVAPSAGARESRPRRSRARSGVPGPLTSVEAARTPSGPQRLAAGLDAPPAAPLGVRRSRGGLGAAGSPATPAGGRGEELSGARVARRELRVATGTRLRGLAKSPQPRCSSDVNQGAKPGPLLTHGHGATPGPRASPRRCAAAAAAAAASPFLPLLKRTLPVGSAPRGPHRNRDLRQGPRAKPQLAVK